MIISYIYNIKKPTQPSRYNVLRVCSVSSGRWMGLTESSIDPLIVYTRCFSNAAQFLRVVVMTFRGPPISHNETHQRLPSRCSGWNGSVFCSVSKSLNFYQKTWSTHHTRGTHCSQIVGHVLQRQRCGALAFKRSDWF